jgi:DNA-binding CsgD family transcriptional regulator
VLLHAGRVSEARTHGRAAVALADAGHGHPEHIGTLGNALTGCELYADGRRLLAAEADRHRRAGNSRTLAGTLINLADLLCRTGELRAAERAAAEAVAVSSRLGERSLLPICLAGLAETHTLLGEPDALALAEQAAGSAGELGNRAWAAAALAQARLLAGDPAGALAALAPIDAVEPAGYREPNQLRVAGIRLEALIALGRREQAGQALAQLAAAAARSSTHWARATAARFRGVLAGSDEEAEQAFAAALAELDPRVAPLERALAELDHGRRLARAGHRKRARDSLERAHAGFTTCAARPLAEAAARAIGATAPRLRPRQDGTGQQLTTRERQVAERAAAGASDKEIAAALYLSARTVDFHLRNIFRKLGIRTRAELASRFPS